ncbi:ABC transporter ATP-binding protein [Cellulomonas sp. KRMCY2]|uniref:ABC transporter ATP-binding protein n=1 Tax=Cellulomonas sp. KRMCY2 TaxID=1304865 RepID=UPI00045E75BF|nr:ABC transporter ATP-binding protein [Cellulomonas sp. KRMCY2]
MTSTLHLAGTVRRGPFTADLDLSVAPGEVVALLGPNGAGKSTVLRTIGGLEPLAGGRLTLGGTVLDDVAARYVRPAAERRIGTVFQDHRLFPHLSVVENVAFGPRAAGARRGQADRLARQWLDRLGVGDLGHRRPAHLSGGQAQRVAIARALATDPRALLLDEPLAALDAQARGEVQRALADHLGAFAGPCLLVTHDLVDALVLADRLAVLEDGRIVQQGPPADVVRQPATQYVARLLGVNLMAGRLDREGDVDRLTLAGGVVLRVPRSGSPPGAVHVAVRPSAIHLTVAPPSDIDLPGWAGTVATITPWGEHLRVEVAGTPPAVAEVRATDVGPDRAGALRPGAAVRLTVDVAGLETYPR